MDRISLGANQQQTKSSLSLQSRPRQRQFTLPNVEQLWDDSPQSAAAKTPARALNSQLSVQWK